MGVPTITPGSELNPAKNLAQLRLAPMLLGYRAKRRKKRKATVGNPR